MLDVFSWLLRAAAAEAHFPFPWEGVAEGRGRGFHSGRQTAACHNEFWCLYYYPALRAPLLKQKGSLSRRHGSAVARNHTATAHSFFYFVSLKCPFRKKCNDYAKSIVDCHHITTITSLKRTCEIWIIKWRGSSNPLSQRCFQNSHKEVLLFFYLPLWLIRFIGVAK